MDTIDVMFASLFREKPKEKEYNYKCYWCEKGYDKDEFFLITNSDCSRYCSQECLDKDEEVLRREEPEEFKELD